MHSNFHFNNNNNQGDYHSIDNGYRTFVKDMRFFGPNWSGAAAGPTKLAHRSEGGYQPPAAKNRFSNMVLPRSQNPYKTEHGQWDRYQQSGQHHRKASNYDRGNRSPPAYVHQYGNNNNVSKKYQRPRSAVSSPEHQHSESFDTPTVRSYTTDQHYEHYYSYYYHRQPDLNTKRKMSRVVVPSDTKKESFKDEFRVEGRPAFKEMTTHYVDDPHTDNHVHHILKEKPANNNVILSHEEYFRMGAQEDDDASKEVHQPEAEHEVRRLQFLRKVKRKLRTRSDSDAAPAYLLASKAALVIDAAEDSARVVKLPSVPTHKALPKHKPVNMPRVPLYSSQSPRMSRLNLGAARYHDHRARNTAAFTNGRPKQEVFEGEHQAARLPSPSPVKHSKPTDWNLGGGLAADTNPDPNDELDDDDDPDDLDNVSDFGEYDSESSTDSENGYRSNAYKLTHPSDKQEVRSVLSSEISDEELTNPESLLVPSLFPYVPPYLAFSSNTQRGPAVPPELFRVMKWRITNVMPKVVRLVLSNSGMRLLKKTNDWMGVWGKHMRSPCFKTIRPYQKINHLPGSFKIGRKDACWRNLQKQMNKHGKKDFGFMPKTYIIPHDLNVLRKNWPKYAQRNVKWIIKPPASARGAGIRVVNRWAQIPKRRPLIVQKYIERPMLINGSKFDLRLYVLVTSVNPLRVYMYHNGLARFASVKYSEKSDTLNDRCMHLTNYSINKLSSNYSKNEDVNACHGHKWTIKSLWLYLENRGVRTDYLWEALRKLVLRTVMAGEQSIHNMIRLNVESKYSCFELFGFDVLLDADLVPWLLEVNISPSLHSDLPLDAHVKAPLVQSVLNTALYNVPPKFSLQQQKEIATAMSLPGDQICYDKRLYINYLSRTERIKHNMFTRKTLEDRSEYVNAILDNLTPDDVRCLIVAEDELARCTPLERIFPTSESHKYLKYTESPRYYNRLLDAWEARYANNRAEGIALLRKYCERKYHLEVPPPPTRKPLTYRTRALTITRRTALSSSMLKILHLKRQNQRLQRMEFGPQSSSPSDSSRE